MSYGTKQRGRRFEPARRDFLKAPLAAGAAGALLRAHPASSAGVVRESAEGQDQPQGRVIDEYDPANIKLARRVSDKLGDEDMLFLKQIGLFSLYRLTGQGARKQ